jgi:hypothetical protein
MYVSREDLMDVLGNPEFNGAGGLVSAKTLSMV